MCNALPLCDHGSRFTILYVILAIRRHILKSLMHISDGHRKILVEHTLHVLLLPGLHSTETSHAIPTTGQTEASSSRSLLLPSASLQQAAYHSTLGMDLSKLSPLHLRLPVTSRLSFNDAGKITYHRDIWDVKVCYARVGCHRHQDVC